MGTVTPFITQEDVDYLAMTVWAEARGEGRLGMQLVASVIKNRRDSPNDLRYGATIRQVCTKPKQFSCWLPGDPNYAKLNLDYLNGLNPVHGDGLAWQQARQIAFAVLSGITPDQTNGATYYHTAAVDPSWDDHMRQVAHVGHHLFYVDA